MARVGFALALFAFLLSGEALAQSTAHVMQEMVARYRLAGLPPDVLITVPVDAARTLDFHRAAEMIELGRRLTAKALDDAGC